MRRWFQRTQRKRLGAGLRKRSRPAPELRTVHGTGLSYRPQNEKRRELTYLGSRLRSGRLAPERREQNNNGSRDISIKVILNTSWAASRIRIEEFRRNGANSYF